jgi:hypothetical protein
MLLKTRMKKVLGILFSALLIVATFGGTDAAQARNGRTGAFIGGALLGTVAGAAIASGNRGYSNCDAYGNCYERERYYARPAHRGLVWSDRKDCFVSRYDYPYGPCRAY